MQPFRGSPDLSPDLGGAFRLPPDQGLYPISVVTELTGIGAHTLRGYERAGLLAPARTDAGSRRYSDNDLARLRRIATLAEGGVNLAGIRHILALEYELAGLRGELAELRRDPPPGSLPTGSLPTGSPPAALARPVDDATARVGRPTPVDDAAATTARAGRPAPVDDAAATTARAGRPAPVDGG
jgi:MerR family transcriptional regulator/heat shock protein HspR